MGTIFTFGSDIPAFWWPVGVCVNFVGADVFLLVAGLIWLARSHPDGNLLVSASHASYAAAEQPVWRVVRNRHGPAI